MICPKCNHKLPKGFYTTAQKNVNRVANCPNCNVKLTTDDQKFMRTLLFSGLIFIVLTVLIAGYYGVLIDAIRPDGNNLLISVAFGVILGIIVIVCTDAYIRFRQAVKIVEEDHYQKLRFSNVTCPKCNCGLPHNFINTAEKGEALNCPNCSVQLEVDIAKVMRAALFSFLVASVISSPAIFFCYRLAFNDCYRIEALIQGGGVLGLVLLYTAIHTWSKSAFKVA